MNESVIMWRKSSFSSDQGNCVEVAQLPDGATVVRDSKHPGAAILTFTRAEWSAFVEGCKAGEFDAAAV